MKKFLFALGLIITGIVAQGQQRANVIFRDTVYITNELYLQNATKNISGYLKNTGNGRTVFSLITINDVQTLQTTLDGKAPFIHSHAFSDLTGTANLILSTGSYANPSWITSLAWNKITGAPAGVDTSNLSTRINAKLNTSDTASMLTAYRTALLSKSNTGHSHIIGDVTGLQMALNLKLAISDSSSMLSPYRTGLLNRALLSHTHDDRYFTEAEISTSLAGKANTSHTHAQSDVNDLVTDLSSKVPMLRTLTINGVTQTLSANRTWTISSATDTTSLSNRINGKLNLSDTSSMLAAYRSSLISKSNTGHVHGQSDVTGLPTALNLKLNIADTSNMLDNYRSGLLVRVPVARTLTINGTTYDLTANRSWTISTTTDTGSLSARINTKLNISDTSSMLLAYRNGLNNRAASSHSHVISDVTNLQTSLNAKLNISDTTGMMLAYRNALNLRLKIADTATMLDAYQPLLSFTPVPTTRTLTINGTAFDLSANRAWTISSTPTDTVSLSNRINLKLNISDTSGMLSSYRSGLNLRLKITDTAAMLSAYQTGINSKANVSHAHSGGDITSGTIADARLSSNVPLKNVNNTFTGRITQVFNGTLNLQTASSGSNYSGIDILDNTGSSKAQFTYLQGTNELRIGGGLGGVFPTFYSNGAEVARFDADGKLGLGTIPTHSVTIPSTGTGFAYYNTIDKTTNYERFREYWSGNIFHLETQASGTGAVRPFQFTSGSSNILMKPDTISMTGLLKLASYPSGALFTNDAGNVSSGLLNTAFIDGYAEDIAALEQAIDDIAETDTSSLSSRINSKASLAGNNTFTGLNAFHSPTTTWFNPEATANALLSINTQTNRLTLGNASVPFKLYSYSETGGRQINLLETKVEPFTVRFSSNSTDVNYNDIIASSTAYRSYYPLFMANFMDAASARPGFSDGYIGGEVTGFGGTVGEEYGFLRLSAGGHSNKTAIDLAGPTASVSDMDKNIVFYTNGTERARINGTGLHAGTLGLSTYGTHTYIDNSSTGDIVFRTGNLFVERARVNAAGAVIVSNFVSTSTNGYGFNSGNGLLQGMFASGSTLGLVALSGGDITFGTGADASKFAKFENDDNTLLLKSLIGTGTRYVTASSTGVLGSVSTIPQSDVTNLTTDLSALSPAVTKIYHIYATGSNQSGEITAALGTGGVELIVHGNVLVSSTINIPDNTIIRGMGGSVYTTSASLTVFDLSGNSNVVFKDLKIDGPSFTVFNSTSRAINAVNTASTYTGNYYFENVVIEDFAGYGYNFDYVKNALIVNTQIDSVGYAGGAGRGQLNIHYKGGYVKNIGPGTSGNAYGILFGRDGTTNSLVLYPRSKNCSVDGMLIENNPTWEGLDTHAGEDIWFTNNTVRNVKRGIILATSHESGNSDIDDYAPQRVKVKGNRIYGTGAGAGILLTGTQIGSGNVAVSQYADGCTFEDNYVEGFGENGNATTAGGIFFSYTRNLKVKNNTVIGSYHFGINAYIHNNNFDISGNTITDVGSTTNNNPVGIVSRSTDNTGTINNNLIGTQSIYDYAYDMVYGIRKFSTTNTDLTISGNRFSGGITAYFNTAATFDAHTHAQSDITNLSTDLAGKQATLVSGTNIKTVNGNSLLGSGNITISSGGTWGSITGTLSDQTDLSSALALKAPLASPTFTGTVVLPSTTSIGSVSSTELGYLDNVTSAIQTQLNGKSASSHTHAQSDITGLTTDLGLKAPLASPSFTGSPQAPTAATSTNSTQIATTAFVKAQAGIKNRVVLSADDVNNNATANTLEDVEELSFAVTAGVTYTFKFNVWWDAAATTTGSRWTINGPAATILRYQQLYNNDATTFFWATRNSYNQGTTTGGNSSAVGNIAVVEGVITPSASGTIQLRFASEISSSAITAKAGISYVEWEVLD